MIRCASPLSLATMMAALCLAAALPRAGQCAQAGQAGNAPAELARQKNCLTCHSANRTVLGPGFREIATRYADKPEAPRQLAEIIVRGGVGRWGKVPMPANTQISQADALALAHWVLGAR